MEIMEGKQIKLRITEIRMDMAIGISKQIIVQQTLIIAITNVKIGKYLTVSIVG